MKTNRRKRVLAAVLCMVMLLTGNFTVLAEGEILPMTEAVQGAEVTSEAALEPTVAPESTEQPEVTPEPTAIPEPTAAPEPTAVPEPTVEPTAEPGTEPEPTQQPEAGQEPELTPSVTPEPGVVYSEEMQLKQEFTDASGKLVQRVTADIPAGAFEAESSQVTMEVKYLDTVSEEHIKNLMNKQLPQDYLLGDYMLYDIEFKVNGETVDSLQPIAITFEKSNLEIKDTKKANVFYYNPEDPAVAGDADELVEITQRSELIESLQKARQSLENIEDYDLSAIIMGADGFSDQITLEGRTSTIYGCYVEEEPEEEPEVLELSYEDDEVVIKVSAAEEGIIPAGAELKVTPITSEYETKTQYEEVEKQIQEKAAEEEKEVAGFLAYDIIFVDAEGNEMEPNGKVKVSMSYKTAVMPAEVNESEVEDAEVSVLHLEEDEAGNVKEVVNMSEKENTKVDTLATTEGQKVQSVEVETESFSVFAVAWEGQGVETLAETYKYKYEAVWNVKGSETNRPTANIYFVDESGNDISGALGLTQNKTINVSGTGNLNADTEEKENLEEIGEKYSLNNNTYIFQEAHCDSYDNKRITTDISYNPQQKDGKRVYWHYWYNDWKNWKSTNDRKVNVYLVYEKVEQGKVTEKETIDTAKEKIQINLFNYNGDINTTSLATKDQFYFFNQGPAVDGRSPWSNNKEYTHPQNQKVYQNYLKANLSNGYPVLKNGTSLSPLFNGGTGVTPYQNLTGLFYKQGGYYVYDSSNYHAQLEGSKMKVYNATLSPSKDSFKYGNFLPFNTFPSYANDGSLYSVVGGREKTDMWFGMDIGFSFIQPKNGYADSKDMVFNFRGDDDVWVFIDGVKVLDLGGIHDKKEGSINFRSGRVHVGQTDIEDTNLAALYKAAYKEQHPGASESEVNEYLSSIFVNENGKYTRFKNYSSHTFKFFYLERGAGAANCKIEFNMPTIPANSVMVTKEVETENGVGSDYVADIDYQFNIKKVGAASNKYTYDVRANDKLIEAGKTTDENGKFTLRHGQTAVFQGFLDNDVYIVKELGASLGDGYEVSIDDAVVEIQNEEGETTSKMQSASTGELTVYLEPSVVFTNKVKDTGTLTLKKLLKDSAGDPNKEFIFELKVNGKLYNGSYSLNGEPKPETTNGQIKLRANDVVTITGFPYGTKVEVKELLDGSYLPTYTQDGLYECTLPIENPEDPGSKYDSVTGKIAGNAAVTVSNEKVDMGSGKTQVTISKTWENKELYADYIPDSIEVELYQDTSEEGSENYRKWDADDILVTEDADGHPLTAKVEIGKENEWTHTWSNLPGDTNYVAKEYYPDGFKWKSTSYTNALSDFVYVDRVESCRNKIFNLGRNNMLLVKKGKDYYIWTVYDLGLNQKQLDEIAVTLGEMGLSGVGNIGTLKYDHGIQEDDTGISLTPLDEGWQLKFDKSSTWSQFWCLQYNRRESIDLFNTIVEDYKTKLTVNKVWVGDTEDNRPNSITVRLKQDGNQYDEDVEITKELGWTHTWEVPYYYKDENGKFHVYQYTVEEIAINGKPIEESGYNVSYSEMKDKVITITNSKGVPWRILKISSSSPDVYLKDAWFELTKNSDPETKFYGKTDLNGLLKWYVDSEHQNEYTSFIPNGTYTLKETKAPGGYALNEEEWTIEITNGRPTIKRINSTTLQEEIVPAEEDEAQITYYFENTPLYELPSTGGTGIFVYTIGGTLLLIAATLLLYKMKREGVLKG